jgi:hypothetical protein
MGYQGEILARLLGLIIHSLLHVQYTDSAVWAKKNQSIYKADIHSGPPEIVFIKDIVRRSISRPSGAWVVACRPLLYAWRLPSGGMVD